MPVASRELKRVRAMEDTDDLKKFKAFNAIRQSRAVARLWGIRARKPRKQKLTTCRNLRNKQYLAYDKRICFSRNKTI